MDRTIQHAAKAGDLARLRSLLKAGCSADDADDFGLTPLMHAATAGQTAAVSLLLEAGANTSKQDRESGYSALHRAFLSCEAGSLEAAAALVRGGCSVDTPLDHDGLSPLDLLMSRHGDTIAALAPICGECFPQASVSGDCFSWGMAGNPALGHAATTGLPKRVKLPAAAWRERRSVVGVASAKYHSVLWDAQGDA